MIVDPLTLAAFVPAALALNVTPGADMMFCLAQGIRGGPRVAAAASAGISAGAMVNVLLAGIGLGALVAAHPNLFEVIRWAGVAYLVVLGWRALRTPLGQTDAPVLRQATVRRAFREAVVVNITNPKVILFILAFLPQFVDPARGGVLWQFLILGGVFGITGFCVNASVGIFAGGIGRVLTGSPRIERAVRALSATVFGLLALKLALEARPT